MTAGDPVVLFEKRDGIAWLTLNRPRAYNAIDLEARDLLWTLLEVAALDDEIGVVVFRGAGERAFSSGADLSDFGTSPSLAESRRARRERDLWDRLAFFEKPLIAAVHGYALGAGCELSLYCDFRIASDDALFGLPEVSLGYLPSAGGTQTAPRLLGLGRGLDLVLSGQPITAHQALEWGLVHQVVPRAELDAAAEALAHRLVAQPPGALRATKAAVIRGLDLWLDEGLQLEAALRLQAIALAASRPAAGSTPAP
jgi:enoyl-CoA hydratase/carnithine racemase